MEPTAPLRRTIEVLELRDVCVYVGALEWIFADNSPVYQTHDYLPDTAEEIKALLVDYGVVGDAEDSTDRDGDAWVEWLHRASDDYSVYRLVVRRSEWFDPLSSYLTAPIRGSPFPTLTHLTIPALSHFSRDGTLLVDLTIGLFFNGHFPSLKYLTITSKRPFWIGIEDLTIMRRSITRSVSSFDLPT